MNATITVKKKVEIKTLKVKAEVRYWEDAQIDGVSDENGTLTPCKNGDNWEPIIDVDTGKILNWEQGKKASIHFKVCDCCSWELNDENGEVVASLEDDYVPSSLCPKRDGYGDYIIMEIDEEGNIKGWSFDLNDFIPE